jgi:D-alanine-D-alanine ligase-like ATP-grasp enzyme
VTITVVRDSWRLHPLAWIHRAEAGAIAGELRRTGRTVNVATFREDVLSRLPPGPLLLRLSDPVMFRVTRALEQASIAYIGPGAEAMERCYDKYEACRIAAARGVSCPATALAHEADAIPRPLVLKPRRGSDSIGVRLIADGAIPARLRNAENIAQEQVRGTELTVGVFRGRAGMPLRIDLPEGVPYSFARKYLLRPRSSPLADSELARRICTAALEIAGILGADWAARIDLMIETATGRLRFLECDVAPLVGAGSAFAASLAAAGIGRNEQFRLLLGEKE